MERGGFPMRRVVLLIIVFLNIFVVNSYAISAKSAILIDGASGRVLYEHNAYEKLPMASTTKIMTGLLACESGKLSENVKTSAFASGTEGSSLWLKIGEKQTLENLTYGLMLKSGNDAAVAIAEYLGGSIDAFALLMNKKAREIGAKNTSFENPHGLDSSMHYTTAYDLALIAKEAMNNKKFREIVSTKTYSIPMKGEKWDRALKNHNKLLWRYDGCNGVKTGYTKISGRCLVSSAERNGELLICVTLNAPDDWNDHEKLLNDGFSNYTAKKIAQKGDKAYSFTYDKENGRSVDLIYADDYKITVGGSEVITTKIETENIQPPQKKGTIGGHMYIYCNGEEMGCVTLITKKAIKPLSFTEKIKVNIRKLLKLR